jgi:hypothetical protein
MMQYAENMARNGTPLVKLNRVTKRNPVLLILAKVEIKFNQRSYGDGKIDDAARADGRLQPGDTHNRRYLEILEWVWHL